jgi:hypothetical protein
MPGADTKRCESKTATGRRCKRKALVYLRHTDGLEYLSCAEHQSRFRPCQQAAGRPVGRVDEVGKAVGRA